MPYIPSEWIMNQKNEEQVHSLLEKLNTDLQDIAAIETEVLRELTILKETILVEKVKSNAFYFGA